MPAQLTANATLTEQQILTSSAYDAATNPLGISNGEIYFATDTKKVFLALVSGSDLNWRIVESSSTASSTGSSQMLNSNPTFWYDANTPYSVGDADVGEKVGSLMDLSGNDFHAAQQMGSRQFTLTLDSGVKYFDEGELSYGVPKYRMLDTALKQVGLRTGSILNFSNGSVSFMLVFKLRYPWASGAGVDNSGGSWPNDTHTKPYEECTSFAERSNTSHHRTNYYQTLTPFYHSGVWGSSYWSSSAAKLCGMFPATMLYPRGVSCYLHPKAGIYNHCHETWNTLFFRSSSDGKAMEILLNGRNWLALSMPMKEGVSKVGDQLGWTTAAPTAGQPLALNDKWETNTETEAKTTYYKYSGGHHLMPYVEQGYEYYPMDGKDGGESGSTHNCLANTGGQVNLNNIHSNRQPTYALWSVSQNCFSGVGETASIVSSNRYHPLDSTNAPLDITGMQRTKWAEFVTWRRRITDEERNGVLAETHAKYAAFGGPSPMPDLPGSNAAGNSGGMMPSKNNILTGPWI